LYTKYINDKIGIMEELLKYRDTNRVIFPKNKQTEFLNRVCKISSLNWEQLAKHLGINSRLLRYYRNEKYSLSIELLKKIIRICNIKIPLNIKIKKQFWTNSINAKVGGLALIKKYGKIPIDEKVRKDKWKNWWHTTGKYSNNPVITRNDIRIPNDSEDLAELFGILIGDGGITKYQITVTLNSETDREYSLYVLGLFNKIFKITTNIYKKKNSKAINIVLSSINAIEFLKSKGIKQGNKLKQGLSIPDWIMKSKKFKIACLRGLIDTDGCVVHETHKINNRNYIYPRLNFTSASPPLIEQSVLIFKELGFNPKIRRRDKRSVQLENLSEICQYFNVVGSGNPKHKKRISRWT